MALVLKDRVQETATPNTTVSFSCNGPVTGFQAFSTIGNGNTTYYTAVDGSGNWESGLGTYTTAGDLVTRTTISASSNAGSAVTFSGAVSLFVSYPATKSVNLDASGNVSPLGTVASGTWQGSTVGVAYGGTGVTASTGANSVVLRDANENIIVNSVTQELTSTISSATITTLTPASSHFQVLTGTTTQTYKLPDATSLPTGSIWVFDNDSTGNLTVTDNAGTTIDVVAAGGYATVFLEANGTVGGEWGRFGMVPSEVNWGTNSLNLGGLTVITNGTWNGATIAYNYGGTGLTSFAAANNALYSTSASALTAGTLPVLAGGTGVTTSTGTGSNVLNTSPILVTPALGTPSSGTLTNCTFPTLNQNTTGSSGSCTGNAATATTATTATTANALNTANSYQGVNFTATGSITVGSGLPYSFIYMSDSDEGTRQIHCNSNNIGFLNQAGGWGSYCVDDGSWVSAGTISGTNITTGGNVTGSSTSCTGNAASATYLNSSNYIQRTGSSGNATTDFQNTPAGSTRIQGDDANLANGPGNTWWFYQNMRHSNGGNYWGTQVAWGWEDNANRLATRNVTGGSFGGWVYYLNSANYTSYAPSLTGGGASGTWGINVTGSSTSCTGNAASATYAGIRSAAAIAASGTSVTFSNIPVGCKRITLVVNGISTTGTVPPLIRIGNALSGIFTTGYAGQTSNFGTSTISGAAISAGFDMMNSVVAANTYSGQFILSKYTDSNIWVCEGSMGPHTAAAGGGVRGRSPDMGYGELGQLYYIQIALATTSFDGGAFSILYE